MPELLFNDNRFPAKRNRHCSLPVPLRNLGSPEKSDVKNRQASSPVHVVERKEFSFANPPCSDVRVFDVDKIPDTSKQVEFHERESRKVLKVLRPLFQLERKRWSESRKVSIWQCEIKPETMTVLAVVMHHDSLREKSRVTCHFTMKKDAGPTGWKTTTGILKKDYYQATQDNKVAYEFTFEQLKTMSLGDVMEMAFCFSYKDNGHLRESWDNNGGYEQNFRLQCVNSE